MKPEEVVRQLYAHRLMEKYKYPKELLEFEVPAMFAGKSYIDDKRIDIAIYSDKTKKKLMSIPIPEIDDELQRKVKTSVMKSLGLRQNSMDLFEIAKHAVEIAIEKDEATATEYLASIK